MMVPFSANPRRRQFATRALLIVAATVAAAAPAVSRADGVPGWRRRDGVDALRGVDQAYREIDVRIYVMIAGVIPLGLGMEKTGTATFVAEELPQLAVGWTALAVLLALYGPRRS